jgi:hypothetical protein
MRSIPLRDWAAVLAVTNVDFVSLQYSECESELGQMRARGAHISHWQEAIDDYAETAALVSALDLVVSVQTAVVHLAGALGTPVWALISAVPEWRYGREGSSMPWYPGARLFRQSVTGEWDDVLAAVTCALPTMSST